MSMWDFDDLIGSMDESEFEEEPVSLEEFITSGFLELDRNTNFALSPIQMEIVKRSTQIYKKETLIWLYGEDKGESEWLYTENEVITMLGKGSGKDLMAAISCAYIVYKLLCLKDPAAYYNKPPGDAIDIINVAINADQANRVFFAIFKNMITNSPWFAGKYRQTNKMIEFDKGVRVHSGHSEMESFEGYNLLVAILDEIAGFTGTKTDPESDPAQAIYDMFEASVTSRFSEFGKIVLLSFPRNKQDFITRRYNDVVGEKRTVKKTHEFILNEDISPTAPGNSFTITWTEDDIMSYKEDRVWAIRRPSWVVNPTKDINEYKRSFRRNLNDALRRFAAEPVDAVGGYFGSHEDIETFSCLRNGVNEEGIFEKWFTPIEDREYYIHVDLARKHDRCVVSVAHVSQWKKDYVTVGEEYEDLLPYVVVDAVRYWTPTESRQVDFVDVRNYIMSLVHRGFDIRKVTFDQWQSDDMINFLNNAGIKAGKLSVGLREYNDMKLMMSEQRVKAPEIEILKRELRQLVITPNGKNVDHPRSGSKDISDSVAGAVYNASTLTPRPDDDQDLEVFTMEDFRRRDTERMVAAQTRGLQTAPPGATMPDDVAFFIRLLGK